MSPLPASAPRLRPRDAAKPIDDFEWPPTAESLSVYEVGPDPFQTRQDPASPVPAARQREQSQLQQSPQERTAERAPAKTQKLLGVLAASAIVAAAAGCVLYGAMAQPIAVHAVHHPAPPPAPTIAPPPITIVATYPVEPSPSSDAHASRRPVPIVAGPIALDPVATNPGLANGASPGTDTPDASIRSLLRRYVEAYDHRDVETAAALWPTLDRDALTRAFAGLDRQDLHFDRCDIDAAESRGSAVCVGTMRYIPSVGPAIEKEDPISWTFDLARSGEDWRIAGLTAH